MYLIRDIMYCKPGNARAMVDKFKALSRLMEKKGFSPFRILTDVSAERYWTVVSEVETEDLGDYTKMARSSMSDKQFQKIMKDYHSLITGGRREIYTIE
jgi:hypothetical protein